MKRCKNCKFWDDAKNGWGSCKLTWTTNMHPDHEQSLAIAYDFEGYSAQLNTHQTFGCVQWEKKE
jgi:hypothetical protein